MKRNGPVVRSFITGYALVIPIRQDSFSMEGLVLVMLTLVAIGCVPIIHSATGIQSRITVDSPND